MGRRRKAREVALQFLYQLDLQGEDDPVPHEHEFWARHPLSDEAKTFAETLVRGTKANQAKIDQVIEQYTENWDLERMAERAQVITAGNHEHGVAGLLDLDWFNRYARAAAEWTRERLDDDHRSYLAALPLVAEVDDATLVHASPDRPEEWEYLVSAEDGFQAFAAFTTRLCFVGHSHLPGVWSLGSTGPEWTPGAVEVDLEHGRRYLVNVGSVGQPRDHDARAAYALWDAARGAIAIRRVPYDVDAARRKIIAAGLPQYLPDG